MLAQFNVPSTLIVGGGASSEAGAQAKRLKAKRAFLVTDTYMVDSGLAGRTVDSLKAEGIEATVFSDVQPDPTDDNVIQGADRRFVPCLLVTLCWKTGLESKKLLTVGPTFAAAGTGHPAIIMSYQ